MSHQSIPQLPTNLSNESVLPPLPPAVGLNQENIDPTQLNLNTINTNSNNNNIDPNDHLAIQRQYYSNYHNPAFDMSNPISLSPLQHPQQLILNQRPLLFQSRPNQLAPSSTHYQTQQSNQSATNQGLRPMSNQNVLNTVRPTQRQLLPSISGCFIN